MATQPLHEWVNSIANTTAPQSIHWCDGSPQERAALCANLVHSGTFVKLNEHLWPDSYAARTAPEDAARSEDRVFIASPQKEDVGPTSQWADPTEMKARLNNLFNGCMRGRTAYVVPFAMGPVHGVATRYGVEITDSAYVALQLILANECSQSVLCAIERSGDYFPCVHSVGAPLQAGQQDQPWPHNSKEKLLVYFPQERSIWSYGTGYGGQSVLSHKWLSLQVASHDIVVSAKDTTRVAAHAAVLTVTAPGDKSFNFAVIAPSGCGKSIFSLHTPTLAGWGVRCVSDNAAWLHIGADGRLRATNPESALVGRCAGVSSTSSRAIIATMKRGHTIFTNVATTADGDVWWEGKTKTPPANLIDWRGKAWTPASGEPAAHPNARYTVPAAQCPVMALNWRAPEGVPLDAIIISGRRSDLAPLVLESFNWTHGVFLGSALSSESTVATSGQVGVLHRDPFAILPFLGCHLASYLSHWLALGKRLGSHAPAIFGMNLFRRDSSGHFAWPGFGENTRLLKWMCGRLTSTASAHSTPLGFVPNPDDLDLLGLDINPATLTPLLSVGDVQAWSKETTEISTFFASLGHTPEVLKHQLEALQLRLRMGGNTPPTTNVRLLRWVYEQTQRLQPKEVVWCDGTREEWDSLTRKLCESGTFTRLNPRLRPNSFLARSTVDDVARVEERTFICTPTKEEAGPTNNWTDPKEMHATLDKLFAGSMRGRTLYVLPFCMGALNSPFSKFGVEITDSAYVVVNMHIMSRCGTAVLRAMGDRDFVPALHSVGAPLAEGQKDVPWPCNPTNKYIVHFPAELSIESFGSGYGGNALLGKKCYALRIASYMGWKEGWLAEHCLHGETRVTLDTGVSMRIADLAGLPRVLTLDKERQAFVPTSPSAHLPRPEPKECIRLVFSDGRTLVCTPDHRILTQGGWLPAAKLVPGKSAVVLGPEAPLYTPSEDNAADLAAFALALPHTGVVLRMTDTQDVSRAHAFARILGYFLTDGWMSYHPTKKVYAGGLALGHCIDAERAASDVQLAIGTTRSVKPPNKKDNVFIMDLPSALLRDLHQSLGIQPGKRVFQAASLPAFILAPTCPKSFVREFLGGLFGGDGQAPTPQDHTWNPVGFAVSKVAEQQASISLLFGQIKSLLARFGIDGAHEVALRDVTNNHAASAFRPGVQVLQGKLMLPLTELLIFHERVGFRLCAHKQQRLTVAAAFFRMKKYSCEQRRHFIERVEELTGYSTAEVINPDHTVKRRRLNIAMKDAYAQTLQEMAQSEVYINTEVAVPTYSCVKQALRGHTDVELTDTKCKSPKTWLAETGASVFFSDPKPRKPAVVAVPTTIAAALASSSSSFKVIEQEDVEELIDYEELVEAVQCCRHKGTYGVSRDLGGFPTWHALFVGSKPAGAHLTFDISIPKSHNFVAEGVTVHNCLILRLESPEANRFYVAAAFPSACGKTNLAMLVPTLPGWKVTCVGDDIAWMRVGADGRLYATNPEAGFFGVAPGTSELSNQSALATMYANSIFTNVALTDDGDVWWEEKTPKSKTPAHLVDWTNQQWTPECGRKAAHPNSRYTIPAQQCPVIDPDWESPNGVPISAIMFGGRRAKMVPLVTESLSWNHGVFLGATCSSETTAAAAGAVGVVRRDPFAMLPFCGYNMGHYFAHWVNIGKRLGNRAPKIYYVNWFRKDEHGKFLWPGFGENSRVLKWMCERAQGIAPAVASPIGLHPTEDGLDLIGLDMPAETMKELLAVRSEEWRNELPDLHAHFEKFGNTLPAAMRDELNALEDRLKK